MKTNLSRLFVRDLVRRGQGVQSDQPTRKRERDQLLERTRGKLSIDSPVQNPPSSLPLSTGFESRVAAHQVAEVGMELIFGSHTEFESVEEGDEGLNKEEL